MENIILYRIQSLKRESLWYSFDGKYDDKLIKLTGQTFPMPFEEWRQKDNKKKLLSSVADMNMFPHWFNKEQINILFNSGYSLFKYEVQEGIYLPKGEVLFDLNSVIKSEEIQDEIIKII